MPVVKEILKTVEVMYKISQAVSFLIIRSETCIVRQLCSIFLLLCCAFQLHAQDTAVKPDKALPARESDYYRIVDIPIPEGVLLEVGGLAPTPDGRLGVSTRRGEVWLINNPYLRGSGKPYFTLFATGLHEPLGLAYQGGHFYASQRSELTRLTDKDGDDRADNFETVYTWPLSGNYHEYSYGPLFTQDGNMLVTLNLSWIGHGASLVPWRGWMLKISPDGEMTPVATGMRSPAGYGFNAAGDVFYGENQGDWVGSGRITHVEQGDFVGNPAGLAWSHLPGSPLTLKPEDIPDTGETLHEVAKKVPGIKPPAVWFPHGLMGISTSDIITDRTGGSFGPFEGQLFVGDQGHSKIMRVYLEKVNGVYQGVCFPFREGFSSGILRMVWGNDGSMFVGMTSRGWNATGESPYGLQRLIWNGKTPFEIKTVKAQPDGFKLEFTLPVDKSTASKPENYKITKFNYKYHHEYGSPVIDQEACIIRGVVVSDDSLSARLVVDGLEEGAIHEIKAEGLRSWQQQTLLHDVGYYTLNNIPSGQKLDRNLFASVTPAHHQHAQTNTPAPKKTAKPATPKPKPNPVKKAVSPQAKRVTKMPASWIKGPDQSITIGTKPGLKFDLASIEVKAGSKIKLTFNNDDDMLHNLVVVLPNTAVEVGEEALKLGLEGSKKNYIPDTDKVLYYTHLLQPETSETIYFQAPEKPGEYTYVCTFPGHAYVMQGTLKVVSR
ncbi:blue (type 1) copper domain-containing protein [Flammeovirgaceae bacterium 311]|nr:blue (type 1) copper domain-containing protein [Flammeovirgaceae bacterium 311]